MMRSRASSSLWALLMAMSVLQTLAIRPEQGTSLVQHLLRVSPWARSGAARRCLVACRAWCAPEQGTRGSKQNPDYHSLGDHAEAVEVEYDSSVIPFDRLLDVFWENHDPTQIFGQGPDVGPQYRSVIFVQNDDDALVALTSKTTEQSKRGPESEVVTEIQPFGLFYPAEAEHQKFELRRKPQLLELLGEMTDEELTSSVLATKLNGYAADLCPANMKKLLDTKVRPFMQPRPNLEQVMSFRVSELGSVSSGDTGSLSVLVAVSDP